MPEGKGYSKAKGPSPRKARKILHDGTVHGKKLTPRQRGFIGHAHLVSR